MSEIAFPGIPSGGAFGYAATQDQTADPSTHAVDSGASAPSETAIVKLDGNGLGGIILPATTIVLVEGQNRMTVSVGPVIAPADSGFNLRANYVNGLGVLTAADYSCELTVGNGAGSEVLSVACSAVTIGNSTVIPVVGGNIDRQVGSDLSIDSGNIITTAGGAFFVTGYFQFTYTPPA